MIARLREKAISEAVWRIARRTRALIFRKQMQCCDEPARNVAGRRLHADVPRIIVALPEFAAILRRFRMSRAGRPVRCVDRPHYSRVWRYAGAQTTILFVLWRLPS